MEKVLITGGTGLLGKEIVKGFIKKNKKVYFTSTSKEKSKRFLKTLGIKYQRNCIPIVQKFNSIDDINFFLQKYKNLNFNFLINNARDISNLKILMFNIFMTNPQKSCL